MKDNVNEIIERIKKNIIKAYNLNEKEEKDFRIATNNYDYEVNDGVIYTTKESVESLYTDENSEKRIPHTKKQLMAIAEYIYATEVFYNLGVDTLFDKYTKKTVLDILSENSKKNITNTMKKDKGAR